MIGRLLYQYKLKFGHGFVTAWYRDRVRWRILETAPVPDTKGTACEIHVLTSKGDWINLMWVLKSFYFTTGRDYSLCIHEDGSLGPYEIGQLKHHFPNARIADRATTNARLKGEMEKYPKWKAFRDKNPLALKVYDFTAFLENDRMFLLDSDILFFREPKELLRRLEDRSYMLNTLNRDWTNGYSVDLDEVKPLLPFEFPGLINSGLGLIHNGAMRIEAIEQYLGLPKIMSHNHRIEQTLIALCCAEKGFEFLPAEYDVDTRPQLPDTPSRHYTGPIRHRMYREGFPKLIAQGILAGKPAEAAR